MSREASLFQALTATDRLIDLLPVLHHHAVSAVEGRSSIIFQFARSGDTLQATSAFGVDRLPPDPWPARLIPEALFRDEKPRFIADISRVVPGAHEYLGTLPAVLVPLAQMQTQMGVLVIGCEKLPSPQQMREAASVGHAFTLALDRAHANGETDLQSELRELLHTFSRGVSSTTLSAGLEMFCIGANRLFGADRTSVWLHDRRARMIGPFCLFRCRLSGTGSAYRDGRCARTLSGRVAPRACRNCSSRHHAGRRAHSNGDRSAERTQTGAGHARHGRGSARSRIAARPARARR